MTQSPSKIAVLASGQSHSGSFNATEPGFCAMCGHAHSVGDPVSKFVPTDTFTDFHSLRKPTSKLQCGWCAGTWNAIFTQKALKTVMCSEGIFPAASNAHIAFWIHNPPAGEWVWVMGDQKRQHIVWRSTVNTSQEVFQVRQGENIMTIRRSRVLEALKVARYLAEVATVERQKTALAKGRKASGSPLKSPFVRLSRDLDEPVHGAIREDLHRLAQDQPDVKAAVSFLQSSTPGELWALTALLYAGPSPSRPEPYFSKLTD